MSQKKHQPKGKQAKGKQPQQKRTVKGPQAQAKKPVKSKQPQPNQPDKKEVTFVFNRDNYIFLLIGIAFIFIGFLLMTGGGSDDPNVFSEDIFNFRRLTLAPILILIGYGIEIYAIMKKPKQKKEQQQ